MSLPYDMYCAFHTVHEQVYRYNYACMNMYMCVVIFPYTHVIWFLSAAEI